jgi:hypothetical protein
MFLKSKPFRAYLIALSNFGVSSRYFHLNRVLCAKNHFTSPEHAWQDIEGRVLDYNPKLKEDFHASGGAQEVVVQILAESRGIIVHGGRALARLLALGALGGEAECYTGYVNKFNLLSDEELNTVRFAPFHKDT